MTEATIDCLPPHARPATARTPANGECRDRGRPGGAEVREPPPAQRPHWRIPTDPPPV